jgi:uracil-DNA glycosylase family 4
MPGELSEALQKKLSDRLKYYDDLGIQLFYRDRAGRASAHASENVLIPPPMRQEEITLPKAKAKLPLDRAVPGNFDPRAAQTKNIVVPAPAGPSLFDAALGRTGETLPMIQSDLGECTRCKLHRTRNKIVFGDGHAKARLVFVGEGPGADEDAQGLPFVGRAGKLLTQMIEAMGLERKDVYICNVVKCRPPENRQPEKDEVAECYPFLLRQIESIAPKVIVCLGATAAQALLETNRGISQFRGQWLDFRGSKLLATYHPAYLLRNPSAKSEVWKDLQKVMAELGLEVKRRKSSS